MVAATLLGLGAYAVVETLDDDPGDDRRCLVDRATWLSSDVTTLEGIDLERARDAGLDDSGPFPDAVAELVELGLSADPLTRETFQAMMSEPEETLGYASSDVDCWVGDPAHFTARGTFDPERIARSERGQAGEAAPSDDGRLLAFDRDGDAQQLFRGEQEPPAAVTALVRELNHRGAIGFRAMSLVGSGDKWAPWSAVALTRRDGWELVMVWAFADAQTATENGQAVLEALADKNSAVADLIEGNPGDRLERDGATIALQAPLAGEAVDWHEPFTNFDPAVAPEALRDL